MKQDIGLKIVPLIFFAAPLFSQTYEIRGKMLEKASDEPLIGGTVYCLRSQTAARQSIPTLWVAKRISTANFGLRIYLITRISWKPMYVGYVTGSSA